MTAVPVAALCGRFQEPRDLAQPAVVGDGGEVDADGIAGEDHGIERSSLLDFVKSPALTMMAAYDRKYLQ